LIECAGTLIGSAERVIECVGTPIDHVGTSDRMPGTLIESRRNQRSNVVGTPIGSARNTQRSLAVAWEQRYKAGCEEQKTPAAVGMR
jgi:hypothetical protein